MALGSPESFSRPRLTLTSLEMGSTVVGVRDLWHARPYDSSTPDGKPTLPCDPNSEALTLTFHNGIQITLRTSGTEPKIKYYSEYCASPSETDWAGLEKVKCYSFP